MNLELELQNLTIWPPSYHIRKSLKAKNIQVQINNRSGLEIVIPHRARFYNIDDILQTHRSWIEKNLKKYHKTLAKNPNGKEFELPLVLDFQAIDRKIQFIYQEKDNEHIRIKHCSENVYLISGPLKAKSAIKRALQRWLVLQAKKYLTPWLENLSRQTNLKFSEIRVRRQSTLWGSCTAKQQISLNAKLLFLPSNVTQYVLLHELCHTKHMNHSARFWNLLLQFDPDCLQHRRTLRQSSHFIPAWVE